MIITAVQIKRMENTGTKLKGIASITLDNMIVIHDIRILEGNSARFLAMPSKAVRAGVFKDIVHPISSEVRIAFERIIFFVFDIAEERKLFLLNVRMKYGQSDSLLTQDPKEFVVTDTAEENNYAPKEKRAEPKTKLPRAEKTNSLDSTDDELLQWLKS